MIDTNKIKNAYFEWLYKFVCSHKTHDTISYRKIFSLMYDIDFDFYIKKDVNRAIEGMDLRNRFGAEKHIENIDEILDDPCNVLEVMIALAIRIEGIMDNPLYGDRTSQWFWQMMSSLGLNLMTDDVYDEKRAIKIIYDFLERRYRPDGKGGLFYIRNCNEDLTQLEIWDQVCIYLNRLP